MRHHLQKVQEGLCMYLESIPIPILQMRKLRHRELKCFGSLSQWVAWPGLDPGHLRSKSVFLTATPRAKNPVLET